MASGRPDGGAGAACGARRDADGPDFGVEGVFVGVEGVVMVGVGANAGGEAAAHKRPC